MKTPSPIYLRLFVAVSITWATAAMADTKVSTGSGQVRSVFTTPTNVKEGRDPFFPESIRALELAVPTNGKVDATSLKVPGISGTPGHLLAIINNHTFAVGEEGDVKTANGIVHVRCLEIQANSVVVEINGQVHRINVETQ